MTRIETFFNELEQELSNTEIVAGLGNGDIEAPDWMSISESDKHVDCWDPENGGSAQMGFYTVYTDGY